MRSVSLPPTFIFWFIAPDDRAIGDRSKYGEYLRTGDEDVLALKEGVEPSYYFLHPLSDDDSEETRSVFASVEDGKEQTTAEEKVTEALTRKLVRKLLCGCTSHPVLVGQNKNKPLVERKSWDPGEEAPSGLVDAIMGEKTLVVLAFNFLLSRSVLTEEEKN